MRYPYLLAGALGMLTALVLADRNGYRRAEAEHALAVAALEGRLDAARIHVLAANRRRVQALKDYHNLKEDLADAALTDPDADHRALSVDSVRRLNQAR